MSSTPAGSFWKEVIIGDGREGRCEYLKGDIVFAMIRFVQVGNVIFVSRQLRRLQSEFVGFLVEFIVEVKSPHVVTWGAMTWVP